MFEHLLAAGEQAGDVGADPHDVLADRFEVEHVVEGRGAAHVGRCRAGQFGDLGDALVGEVTVLLLGEVQERQHRRTSIRVDADELVGALADVDSKVTHRSTSPMIGSMVEITVIVSDIDPPRIKSETAWRFTKLGARTWIR